jgi:hypothetical protein
MPENKLKRQTAHRHTYKSKDGLGGWWQEQERLRQQGDEEQMNIILRALMVWADDGGYTIHMDVPTKP